MTLLAKVRKQLFANLVKTTKITPETLDHHGPTLRSQLEFKTHSGPVFKILFKNQTATQAMSQISDFQMVKADCFKKML